MTVAELREKIHLAVESINDKGSLQAILTLTELPFTYDDEPLTGSELKMLQEREDNYLSGKTELIPWEQVQERVKAKYGL